MSRSIRRIVDATAPLRAHASRATLGRTEIPFIALGQLLDATAASLRASHPQRKVRIVLLLDELDGFMAYTPATQGQFRSIFMEPQRGYLAAVVAGVGLHQPVAVLDSPWFNMFKRVQLSELDEQEARELAVGPVAGYYTYSQDALEALLEWSDRKPRDLQAIASYAVESILNRLFGPVQLVPESLVPSEVWIQHDDVLWAVRRVVDERADEYRDRYNGYTDEQKQLLREALTLERRIPGTELGDRSPFPRAALYNVARFVGQQGYLTALFARWLGEVPRP